MTGVTRLVTLFVREIINISSVIISGTTTTTIIVSRQVADMKPEIRNNLQVVFSYKLTLETKSMITRVDNIWPREDFNMKKKDGFLHHISSSTRSTNPLLCYFLLSHIESLPECYRDAINVSVEILTIFTETNTFSLRLSSLSSLL